MGGPGMRAVELWGIAVLALVILAVTYALRRSAQRRSARRRARPISRATPFPEDSHAGAQQLEPPRRWVGYIGEGDWWSRKYWVCRHDHPSVEEALDCARGWLKDGTWDGRTWTWLRIRSPGQRFRGAPGSAPPGAGGCRHRPRPPAEAVENDNA